MCLVNDVVSESVRYQDSCFNCLCNDVCVACVVSSVLSLPLVRFLEHYDGVVSNESSQMFKYFVEMSEWSVVAIPCCYFLCCFKLGVCVWWLCLCIVFVVVVVVFVVVVLCLCIVVVVVVVVVVFLVVVTVENSLRLSLYWSVVLLGLFSFAVSLIGSFVALSSSEWLVVLVSLLVSVSPQPNSPPDVVSRVTC